MHAGSVCIYICMQVVCVYICMQVVCVYMHAGSVCIYMHAGSVCIYMHAGSVYIYIYAGSQPSVNGYDLLKETSAKHKRKIRYESLKASKPTATKYPSTQSSDYIYMEREREKCCVYKVVETCKGCRDMSPTLEL